MNEGKKNIAERHSLYRNLFGKSKGKMNSNDGMPHSVMVLVL